MYRYIAVMRGSRNRVTEDYHRAFFNSAGEYIAIFVTMRSLTVALSPDIALIRISYLNFNHVKRCRLSSLPQSRVPLSVHKTLVFEGSAATLVVDAPLGGTLSCVSASFVILHCLSVVRLSLSRPQARAPDPVPSSITHMPTPGS